MSICTTLHSNIVLVKNEDVINANFKKIFFFKSALGECFGELAHKSPELQEEFLYNAETQRTLTKNGQVLISALNFFVSSVNTLCNKTMEDTIATVKQYETARLVLLMLLIINSYFN